MLQIRVHWCTLLYCASLICRCFGLTQSWQRWQVLQGGSRTCLWWSCPLYMLLSFRNSMKQ